jgi:hypothetical protein
MPAVFVAEWALAFPAPWPDSAPFGNSAEGQHFAAGDYVDFWPLGGGRLS